MTMRWSARLSRRAPCRRLWRIDQAVGPLFHVRRPCARRALAISAMRSHSLWRQISALVSDGLALGAGADHGQQHELVDEVVAVDGPADELAGAGDDAVGA